MFSSMLARLPNLVSNTNQFFHTPGKSTRVLIGWWNHSFAETWIDFTTPWENWREFLSIVGIIFLSAIRINFSTPQENWRLFSILFLAKTRDWTASIFPLPGYIDFLLTRFFWFIFRTMMGNVRAKMSRKSKEKAREGEQMNFGLKGHIICWYVMWSFFGYYFLFVTNILLGVVKGMVFEE